MRSSLLVTLVATIIMFCASSPIFAEEVLRCGGKFIKKGQSVLEVEEIIDTCGKILSKKAIVGQSAKGFVANTRHRRSISKYTGAPTVGTTKYCERWMIAVFYYGNSTCYNLSVSEDKLFSISAPMKCNVSR